MLWIRITRMTQHSAAQRIICLWLSPNHSMLETSNDVLQKEKAEASTLRNLSALLTLSKAKETYGFKPEKYGLSDKDAAEIAAIFSKYDLNDDMRLEELEQRRLA